MITNVERLVADREGLPKLQTYVISMRSTDAFRSGDTEEDAAVILAHLEYLFDLEARGILLGSGPVGEYTRERLDAMCFVAAPDLDAAVRIAQEEPFHRAGWRINEVQKWRINEGVILDVVREAVDRFGSDSAA